ncbi:aldehyde dehydrogenase family protein [Streptomyces sp. NPDC048425]|uniref:aldehyde dehydrogenase family protein n=1 Tax=Streptomyces sp. NPDC048425 TaxID=3365548 RepID=UPI00371ED134
MQTSSLVDPIGIPLSATFAHPAEGRYIDVTDASTGQVVARIADSGEKDVDSAVASVAEAAPRWRSLPVFTRTGVMLRWALEIVGRRGELAELVARETGALRAEAALDIDRAVDCIRHYAGLVGKTDGRVLGGIPGHFGYTAREPYGVVAGVNSWNSALSLFAWQAAPALACGNGYVLMAHAPAPLGPTLMAHLAQVAGLDAVTAFTGSEAMGTHLSRHPAVGTIAFSGSMAAGQEIIRASAEQVAPVNLQLAVRNSAVVLEDADLETAVPCVLHSRYSCAGQNWFGASHVYVHESHYEEFVASAMNLAKRIKVGPSLDAASQMGPLISRAECDRVDEAVAAGAAEGARVRVGGHQAPGLDGGAYFTPTVVTDADASNPLRARNVAGPVLTVSVFADAERVAAGINAERSGGITQIWGREARAVKALADRLDVGTVWINTHDALSPEIPTTAWRESGYGSAGGQDALDEFTRTKAIMWDLTPLSERTQPLTKTAIATATDTGTDSERPNHA